MTCCQQHINVLSIFFFVSVFVPMCAVNAGVSEPHRQLVLFVSKHLDILSC